MFGVFQINCMLRKNLEYLASLGILVPDLDYTCVNSRNCSNHECLAFVASFVKGH